MKNKYFLLSRELRKKVLWEYDGIYTALNEVKKGVCSVNNLEEVIDKDGIYTYICEEEILSGGPSMDTVDAYFSVTIDFENGKYEYECYDYEWGGVPFNYQRTLFNLVLKDFIEENGLEMKYGSIL